MPCLLFFSCGDFLRISTGPSHALDPLGSHSLSDSLTAGSLSQEGCSKIRRLSGIEAWTRQGLTRFLVLFFIDLASRRVEIGGVARQANGLWVSQVARNFSDAEEGFLTGKRYLIHDRDPLFTAEFLEILKSSGVQSLKLPPCSPNLVALSFWTLRGKPLYDQVGVSACVAGAEFRVAPADAWITPGGLP